MRWGKIWEQNGQALVQVAVAIFALVAIVALAVDVGHLYGERRRMQNAADAGALAGAREICIGHTGAQAEAVAEEYARDRNGAPQADAVYDPAAHTVTVTAIEPVAPFFAGILGIDSVNVPAVAQAACGSARSACGLWPIAFELAAWEPIRDHCSDEPPEETEFVVIDDDKINCNTYPCDPDGDGRNEVILGGNRGWLDFAQPKEELWGSPCKFNCGNNILKCWLTNDYPEKITLPICMLGEPGVKTSAFDTAGSRAGDIVKIPLYDRYCTSGEPYLGGQCNGTTRYHVVDFACVRVKRFEKIKGVKRLIVQVVCDPSKCNSDCGSTTGGPWVPGGVQAVSLLR